MRPGRLGWRGRNLHPSTHRLDGELLLALVRTLRVVLLVFWVQPLRRLLYKLGPHVLLALPCSSQPPPFEVRHMQHLVTHPGQQPVFQLCVSCVALGVCVEVRRPVDLDCDRPVLPCRNIAVLICKRTAQPALEILDDVVLLLLFRFRQDLLLPVEEPLAMKFLAASRRGRGRRKCGRRRGRCRVCCPSALALRARKAPCSSERKSRKPAAE